MERRCGKEEENIYITYNFPLYDAEREAVLSLLTKEEHVITNNVHKSITINNSVTFTIVDDSGCVKVIGFPAAAEETDPVYFTVSYLFRYRDRGDVNIGFAGELAYADWKELMEIVEQGVADRPFQEISF